MRAIAFPFPVISPPAVIAPSRSSSDIALDQGSAGGDSIHGKSRTDPGGAAPGAGAAVGWRISRWAAGLCAGQDERHRRRLTAKSRGCLGAMGAMRTQVVRGLSGGAMQPSSSDASC